MPEYRVMWFIAAATVAVPGALVGFITLPGRGVVAGTAAFSGIAAAGVIATTGASGAALVALAALLSPPGLGWCRRRLGLPEEAATEPTTDAVTQGHPATMTDQQLCAAWRVSTVFLQRCCSATDRAAVVLVRASYLDEFERRDPVGFATWIARGTSDAADPSQFLGPRESPGPR
jgi:hypothetical protein